MVQLVPRQAPALDPHGLGQVRHDSIARLLNAPDVGCRVVDAFIQCGKPLPVEIHNPWLNRLYDYRSSESEDPFGDFDIVQILGMRSTEEVYPALLKAYLLAPDIPFEHIAAHLSISVNLVEGFHTLFFNVRPRLQEPMFISSLLYPNGRQQEFQEDYLATANWEIILLRSAFHRDFKAFFYLMGLQRRARTHDTASALEQVEAIIMNNAIVSADHLGGLNQRHAVGFMNAKNIISSAKAGGQEDPSLTEDPALGNMDIGKTIQDELLQIQSAGS